MQFAENLTDRQAADAVRGQIDWKYALGLDLTDPGFDFSVLSEFRSRLLAGGAEHLLLDTLWTTSKRAACSKPAVANARFPAVLGAIRSLNRLELVGEALRHALIVSLNARPTGSVPSCPPPGICSRGNTEIRVKVGIQGVTAGTMSRSGKSGVSRPSSPSSNRSSRCTVYSPKRLIPRVRYG